MAMVTMLEQAIEAAGGAAELGRYLGITSQAISQWTRVPADRVIQVERATGGRFTRYDLRPDLYPRDEPMTMRAAQ